MPFLYANIDKGGHIDHQRNAECCCIYNNLVKFLTPHRMHKMTTIAPQLVLSQPAENLLSLWMQARGDAALPTTKFIDPIKLRAWVGDISVIHLHEGARRFYVAVHGSNVARHLGPDFNRKYLEDTIPASALPDAVAPYELAIKTNQPAYSIQRATLENGILESLERMVLPCFKEHPDQVSRFLVWVAPIGSVTEKSSSVFTPCEESDLLKKGVSMSGVTSEIYSLSDRYLNG